MGSARRNLAIVASAMLLGTLAVLLVVTLSTGGRPSSTTSVEAGGPTKNFGFYTNVNIHPNLAPGIHTKSALCAVGDEATDGGFLIVPDAAATDVAIIRNAPAAVERIWQVKIENNTAGNISLSVYARCVQLIR